MLSDYVIHCVVMTTCSRSHLAEVGSLRDQNFELQTQLKNEQADNLRQKQVSDMRGALCGVVSLGDIVQIYPPCSAKSMPQIGMP